MIEAEKGVSDADPSGYAGLGVPGGVANPDALRADEDAVSFVRGLLSRTSRRRSSAMDRGC